MNLSINKRAVSCKREAKRLRREGKIPAIVYAEGKKGENIFIEEAQFCAVLRGIQLGYLPTTVLLLKDEDSNEFKAIVKDIQYHPTTYRILHLDFVRLIDNIEVNVKVPIECFGAAECPGVKLGGVLRQVIRHLSVRCLPENIPTKLSLDVKSLSMSQSKRLKAIDIPKGVRPLVDLNEVAAVIAKR